MVERNGQARSFLMLIVNSLSGDSLHHPEKDPLVLTDKNISVHQFLYRIFIIIGFGNNIIE
jgi:hypothetical protein